MTTAERKEKIIGKLSTIDDDSVLAVIERYLDQKDEVPYPNGALAASDVLTDIAVSLQQLNQGRVHSHDEVKQLIKSWQK